MLRLAHPVNWRIRFSVKWSVTAIFLSTTYTDLAAEAEISFFRCRMPRFEAFEEEDAEEEKGLS